MLPVPKLTVTVLGPVIKTVHALILPSLVVLVQPDQAVFGIVLVMVTVEFAENVDVHVLPVAQLPLPGLMATLPLGPGVPWNPGTVPTFTVRPNRAGVGVAPGWTTTENDAIVVLRALSKATQVTVVVPTGNVLPDGGEHVRVGLGSTLSVAVTV
jgi:hypothetical protein